ncbi:MAG TPA: hypothetical protein VMW52_09410 [Phycisphaerae bacterium]|nr:hypothetical protein [Phycisphaerae bacterium]
MKLLAGETFEVRGVLNVSAGTLTCKTGQFPRSYLAEDALAEDAVELTELRVWDDLAALLPGVAATDDLAIIEGTWAANAPRVQSADAKATTVTQRLRFRRRLPENYVAAGDVTLRVRAGMITTASDGTATVDVECCADDEDGGVSADLCATPAQPINSLDKADCDFVITPTALAPGVVLDFRVTIAITDTETGTAVIGEISRMALLRDVKG